MSAIWFWPACPMRPAGTKGISLFMVPKFLPDADGTLGARNALQVVSLEHKLGLHGSPTAVMQYDGATGWMVGAAAQGHGGDVHHDEQRAAWGGDAGRGGGRSGVSAGAWPMRWTASRAQRRLGDGRDH